MADPVMEKFEMAKHLVSSSSERVYFYLPKKFSKELETSVVISTHFSLRGYYGEKFSRYSRVATEIIKNSRWHGGSKDNFPTYFALFMDKDKFIFGSNDGGDYFQREGIKKIWENKEELNEFHETNQFGIGNHVGYQMIKENCKIRVDTKHGTLYGIFHTEPK